MMIKFFNLINASVAIRIVKLVLVLYKINVFNVLLEGLKINLVYVHVQMDLVLMIMEVVTVLILLQQRDNAKIS